MFLYEENEIKITEFNKINYLSKEKIIIDFKKYELLLEGNNLKITFFYYEEMFIKGKFDKVIFLWK